MTSPPFHSLREPMDTAFGKACLVGNPAHTLCTVLPKTVENPQTFGPKCHVGQCSERVTELLLEFSPSAYLTDAPLSRLTRIPGHNTPLHTYLLGKEGGVSGGVFDNGTYEEDGPVTWEALASPRHIPA